MDVVSRLESLRAAGIDASSIIYLLKAGILGYLAVEVELHTVAPVMRETGWRGLPVSVDAYEPDSCAPVTPDDQLLSFTVANRLPLISEDRKLLHRAEAAGLTYYNALLMLDLLVLRGRFSEEEYRTYRERLVSIGRYGADVLSTENTVARAVFAKSRRQGPVFHPTTNTDDSRTP